MSRSQLQATILSALVVVMLLVYTRALRSSAPAAVSFSAAPASVEAQPVEVPSGLPIAEPSDQRDAQRERAAQMAWSRDPFTRGVASAQGSGLTLSGILWDPSAPIAIINGQMVHVGEECEGYRITEIGQDRVAVTDGIETFQLHIAP